MSGPSKTVDYALKLISRLPRVGLDTLKASRGYEGKEGFSRGQWGGKDRGYGTREGRGTLPQLGHEGGSNPYYTRHPVQWYYLGHEMRRQYPPLSLFQLQRMIDLGVVDPEAPVDLVSICNTKIYQMDTAKRHFGVHLTEQGVDQFAAKINIEVQWTTENVIAAVERNGGTITVAYFDPISLGAMVNAKAFFSKGQPIPRRALPPENCLEYYSDPNMRGYLADPAAVSRARVELAQKYGYALPDLSKDSSRDMLMKRKDPRQVFYDLEPGWVVNLFDKVVLKPTDEKIKAYYRS